MNCQNLVHLGYRYSKSGKVLKDGYQAWRCVRKSIRCRGRVHTFGPEVIQITHLHHGECVPKDEVEVWDQLPIVLSTEEQLRELGNRFREKIRANANHQ